MYKKKVVKFLIFFFLSWFSSSYSFLVVQAQAEQEEQVEVEHLETVKYFNKSLIEIGFSFEDATAFEIKKITLWVTRDDGIRWEKVKEYPFTPELAKRKALEFIAEEDGRYGFQISYYENVIGESNVPSPGDYPALIAVVDTKPPEITKLEVNRTAPYTFDISWEVTDANLSYRPCILKYSPDGKHWFTIKDNLKRVGNLNFKYEQETEVLFIRLEVNDLATNSSFKECKLEIGGKEKPAGKTLEITETKQKEVKPKPKVITTSQLARNVFTKMDYVKKQLSYVKQKQIQMFFIDTQIVKELKEQKDKLEKISKKSEQLANNDRRIVKELKKQKEKLEGISKTSEKLASDVSTKMRYVRDQLSYVKEKQIQTAVVDKQIVKELGEQKKGLEKISNKLEGISKKSEQLANNDRRIVKELKKQKDKLEGISRTSEKLASDVSTKMRYVRDQLSYVKEKQIQTAVVDKQIVKELGEQKDRLEKISNNSHKTLDILNHVRQKDLEKISKSSEETLDILKNLKEYIKQKEKVPVFIKIDYSVNDPEQLQKLVLYYTEDKGETWLKYGEISKDIPYFTFLAPREGYYGFYILAYNKFGKPISAIPQSGTQPHIWKLVDVSTPIIYLTIQDEEKVWSGGELKEISWDIDEPFLDRETITLYFSKDAGKNWEKVEEFTKNPRDKKGTFLFKVPEITVERNFFIKLEAKDIAGNLGYAISKPISIDSTKLKVTISQVSVSRAPLDIKTPEEGRGEVKAEEKPKPLEQSKFVVSEENKNLAFSLYREATKLCAKGSYKEAIAKFHSALQLYPDFIDALNDIGYAYYKTGEIRQAIIFLQKAYYLSPQDFTIFYNLCFYLIENNELSDARSLLEQFLKNYNNLQDTSMVTKVWELIYTLFNKFSGVKDIVSAKEVLKLALLLPDGYWTKQALSILSKL